MVATKRPLQIGSDWYGQNAELIAKADALISERLANRKQVGEPTALEQPLCDEILNNILKCGSVERGATGGEASSVLLLGEAGSGKTHVVEWCLGKLQEAHGPRCVVMRAHGGAYATDVECIRHLASQAGASLDTAPRANASFEEGMEWIRGVLRESLRNTRSVVIVLDKFECFCSRARQTLLYNLFDVAQDAGVQLSIIGTSEKMDVMNELEKRIKSRFSMRHLHTFLPTNMEGLVQALMAKFRLTASSGLKASFLSQFHEQLEAALSDQRSRWIPHLDLGRPPSWFLWKCLPIASFLQGAHCPRACTQAPAAKRLRTAPAPDVSLAARCLPKSTERETRAVFLDSLSEAEHIVLLALFRLCERRATMTLNSVLHEVQLLHEGSSRVTAFVPDRYCAAFDRLVQLRLVKTGSRGAGEVSLRYLPCQSLVHHAYGVFVQDLGGVVPNSTMNNPLCSLPSEVQQWASRQRAPEARLPGR